jgi:hypothetical protein
MRLYINYYYCFCVDALNTTNIVTFLPKIILDLIFVINLVFYHDISKLYEV